MCLYSIGFYFPQFTGWSLFYLFEIEWLINAAVLFRLTFNRKTLISSSVVYCCIVWCYLVDYHINTLETGILMINSAVMCP